MPAKVSALDAFADHARGNARSAIDHLDAVLRRLSAVAARLSAAECVGVVSQLLPMNERLEGLASFLEQTHPAQDAGDPASA